MIYNRCSGKKMYKMKKMDIINNLLAIGKKIFQTHGDW